MRFQTRLKFAAMTVFLVAISLANFARAQATAAPPAPVTVAETDQFFTISNGIVIGIISKHSGDLVSMKYHGQEMLASSILPDGSVDLQADPPGDPGRGFGMTDHMYGFWSHDTVAARETTRISIDPATNGGQRGEVSVKGFSDGKKLGHGPGADAEGNFAADIDIRYSLGMGESGIYTYCTFEHKPEYPDSTMGEARFCCKLNSNFDWMLVDAHHNMLYPADAERNGDDKYNYTTVQFEHPAFGWASTSQHVGFFFVNASVEYLTGPPTKVEFECHRDTNQIAAPCVLNYWRSSHYGGAAVDAAKGEEWTKVIGPFLLYCNSGANPQEIWADALAQQKREAAKWPYEWVNGVDYPHASERATVSGRMILKDPLMPDATMWNLRVGLSAPDYTVQIDRPVDVNTPRDVQWQTDAKHYEFWTHGENDGSFAIPAVCAGHYTMHAIADGVLGEFARADVTVEAGKNLDLGDIQWTPVRRGRQIWEIGIPNRSGAEFMKGDDYFHDGMGVVYAELFPNDVNYVVGKSDYHRDWFYLQVPHATEIPAAPPPRPAAVPFTPPTSRPSATTGPAGRRGGFGGGRGGFGAPAVNGRATPWNITFEMPSAPEGKATLRFAIATANVRAIDIAINGKSLGTLDNLHVDSSIGRNGVQGIWFEREFPFDASAMKAGTNVLTLTVPPGSMTAGLIYDYLRLELDDSTAAPASVK